MKHNTSKTNWKSSFNFEFICDIQFSTFFHIPETITTKFP